MAKTAAERKRDQRRREREQQLLLATLSPEEVHAWEKQLAAYRRWSDWMDKPVLVEVVAKERQRRATHCARCGEPLTEVFRVVERNHNSWLVTGQVVYRPVCESCLHPLFETQRDRRTCAACKRGFVIARGTAKLTTCSDACQAALKPTAKQTPRPTAECAHCGKPFEQARSDARYCGGACRVAAHRARTAAV